MMPEQKPRAEPLWPLRRSAIIQNRPADAVATKVLIIASAAEPFASSAEPALKPNKPTHSNPVPMKVIVRQCGAIDRKSVVKGKSVSERVELRGARTVKR